MSADPADAIAVIGLGCRFPGADTPQAFWQLLNAGESRLGPAPPARAAAAGLAPGTPWLGAFVDDVHAFDSDFFELPPREAALLDPQQRLALQAGARALEDAALGRRELATQVLGVFAGVAAHDQSVLTWSAPAADRHAASNTANGLCANRLSYWLKARGPSIAFDTACSSALVAVHYARQSLLAGDCDFALCVAASVMLLPGVTASLEAAGLVSASAACRPFAAGADGYLRGEGAGAVLLCRAAEARARGCRIYALLRGSAINHNGLSNGLGAPNPQAQAEVIRRAHAAGGTQAAHCHYVEAMAASRELADTLELKALDASVGAGRASGDHCGVGSLKGHIGHLEAAAGMAGLIKCALALQQGSLPASLGGDPPNAYLLRPATRLAPVRAPRLLPRDGSALVGVSAFGFGGANAHLVLSAAPPPVMAAPADIGPWVLTFSAISPAALRQSRDEIIYWLQASDADIAAVCQSSNLSRGDWPLRLAVAGDSKAGLTERLQALEIDPSILSIYPQTAVLLFDGAGADAGQGGWLAQQLAAAAQWRTWVPGIAAVAAEGAGLYAAAVLAGVFDLPTALQLWRLQRLPERAAASAEYDRLVDQALRAAAGQGDISAPGQLRDRPFWRTLARCDAEGLREIVLPPPEGAPVLRIGSDGRDARTQAETLARLYCAQVAIDWPLIHGPAPRQRVALPGHPFMPTVGLAEAIEALPVAAPPAQFTLERQALSERLTELLEQQGF